MDDVARSTTSRSKKTHAPTLQHPGASPLALDAFIDDIPLGVVVLDKEKRVATLNQAAEGLLGITRASAQWLPCRHILRSNLCLPHCPFQSPDDVVDPSCREGDIITRDRRRVPVRCTLSPLTDVRGRAVGFVETVEDMSAHKSAGQDVDARLRNAGLVSDSPQMDKLMRVAMGIAGTDSAVLITGETGTGKDLLAEAIHQASDRAKAPFVKVNCGALPASLLESELFGYRKGAFTGAVDSKPGRIRLAQGGTLFLTEIGDLPLDLQVKLLSFLDDKVIHPLGDTKGVSVDVRLIAATHRDLETMAQQGEFRQDLLFRLNVVRLHVPPLREREGDVRLLLEHFLARFTASFGKPVRRFGPHALQVLQQHPYPGNVRELKNIVEYAVNVCEGAQIELEHLPDFLLRPVPAMQRAAEPQGSTVARPSSSPHEQRAGDDASWGAMERAMIVNALLKANGKRGEAAQALGWGRSTLWRKMKRHGLA